MTTAGTSKIEARRRVRENDRRAKAARAAREKLVEDHLTQIIVEVGHIDEAEVWKKERMAQLRAQVDAEGRKRADSHRAKVGTRIKALQALGETLTSIASRTELGVGALRAMLRHAPKVEKSSAASGGSHALGGQDAEASHGSSGEDTPPPADAGTA